MGSTRRSAVFLVSHCLPPPPPRRPLQSSVSEPAPAMTTLSAESTGQQDWTAEPYAITAGDKLRRQCRCLHLLFQLPTQRSRGVMIRHDGRYEWLNGDSDFLAMMHISSTPCPSTPAQSRPVLSNLVRLLQHSSALTASIVTRLESFEGRFASRLTGPVSRLHDLDRRRGAVSARPATDLILPGQAVLVRWMTDPSAPPGKPGAVQGPGQRVGREDGKCPKFRVQFSCSGSTPNAERGRRTRRAGLALGICAEETSTQ